MSIVLNEDAIKRYREGRLPMRIDRENAGADPPLENLGYESFIRLNESHHPKTNRSREKSQSLMSSSSDRSSSVSKH